jgi:hypothetical protein
MGRIFVITVIVFAAFISCNCAASKVSETETYHYQGYIYTQERQPIPNVKIIPEGRLEEDPIGVTDDNGYFIFEKPTGFMSRLMVEFEGNVIDTIRPISWGPHGRVSFYFVYGCKDTLFIDLNGEKRRFIGIYEGP